MTVIKLHPPPVHTGAGLVYSIATAKQAAMGCDRKGNPVMVAYKLTCSCLSQL